MIYFWHPVFTSIFSFSRWSEKTNNHKELTVFQLLDDCLMIFCASFQWSSYCWHTHKTSHLKCLLDSALWWAFPIFSFDLRLNRSQLCFPIRNEIINIPCFRIVFQHPSHPEGIPVCVKFFLVICFGPYVWNSFSHNFFDGD